MSIRALLQNCQRFCKTITWSGFQFSEKPKDVVLKLKRELKRVWKIDQLILKVAYNQCKMRQIGNNMELIASVTQPPVAMAITGVSTWL